MSLIITDGTEELEGRLEIVSNLADRGQVATPVAVVRRAPHGDHILVGEVVFVSLVDELMCPGDEGEVIDVTKLIGHAITEEPSYT